MKKIIAGNSLISIGYRGENETRQIVFDISEWIKLYGKGNVALIHRRCGDESPYPCVVEALEKEVVWTITNSDVDKPGVGECELMYLIDGRVAKSDIWQTYTHKSLSDASSEVPEPEKSWVDAVIEAALNGGGEVVSPEQIQEAVNSYLENNPVHVEEIDPTIYSWAKQPKKPSYDAAEVGAYNKDEIDSKMNGVANQISSLSTKNKTLETTVEGLQQQLAEEAHFRGYLSTNAKIQALEATPNDFAYSAESGTKWVYDATDGWRDTGTPVPDQLTPASETVPLMNGEASPGSEESYARGDHVHPTDLTRASAEELEGLKLGIDSALDEILEIQENLTGGAVTPSTSDVSKHFVDMMFVAYSATTAHMRKRYTIPLGIYSHAFYGDSGLEEFHFAGEVYCMWDDGRFYAAKPYTDITIQKKTTANNSYDFTMIAYDAGVPLFSVDAVDATYDPQTGNLSFVGSLTSIVNGANSGYVTLIAPPATASPWEE